MIHSKFSEQILFKMSSNRYFDSWFNVWFMLRRLTDLRAGSRAAATRKIERFVITVNGFQPLPIIIRRSILDVAAVLDPPRLDLTFKCRKLIKIMPTLLAVRKISWFEFQQVCFVHLQRNIQHLGRTFLAE